MNIEIIKITQHDELLRRTLKHCWGVESKMSKSRLFMSNDSIWKFLNIGRSAKHREVWRHNSEPTRKSMECISGWVLAGLTEKTVFLVNIAGSK